MVYAPYISIGAMFNVKEQHLEDVLCVTNFFGTEDNAHAQVHSESTVVQSSSSSSSSSSSHVTVAGDSATSSVKNIKKGNCLPFAPRNCHTTTSVCAPTTYTIIYHSSLPTTYTIFHHRHLL